MPPGALLVATARFDGLDAQRVADRIAHGLSLTAPDREIDALPLEDGAAEAGLAAADSKGVLGRIRDSHAIVLAGERLCAEPAPAGALFELATQARQSGVPAYAISASSHPDLFQARILDLQVVLHADGAQSLVRAGRALGALFSGP